jgi:hypothetical protein
LFGRDSHQIASEVSVSTWQIAVSGHELTPWYLQRSLRRVDFGTHLAISLDRELLTVLNPFEHLAQVPCQLSFSQFL